MDNTASTGILSTIFIVAFIGFMLVVLIFALVSSRKQGKETQRLARRLGFAPPASTDGQLMERLRELYQPAKVERVSNLMKKVEGIGSLYIFDVMTSEPRRSYTSSSSGNTEVRNIAILSPYLDLPPFLLMQRINLPGGLGQTLNGLIATGAGWAGYIEWEVVPPDFNLRYMLYVREDPRVEKVFTEETLSRIAQTEHIVARGEGSLLIYNSYDVRRGVKLTEQSFGEHVEQARQLFECLGN